jgi:oligosaccharide repeat unit polymerase
MNQYDAELASPRSDKIGVPNLSMGGAAFYIFAILSIGFMIILLVDREYGNFTIRTYCVLNSLLFLFSFFFNKKFLKLDILSLPQIYLLITFLYTSGLLTLYAFGLEELRFTVRWYDEKYAEIAIKMIIMAVLSLEAGICMSFFYKYNNVNNKTIDIKDNYSDTLFKLGIFLFIVAISVLILSTITGSGYSSILKYGYKDFKLTLKGSDVRFFLTALSWLLPVSVIIMASGVRSKNQYKYLYLFSVLTMTAFFLAGDRGGAFSFLIALVFTLTLIGKKFSYTKILIGAILVLLLVPIIKELRQQPISQTLSSGIELNFEESPFFKAFSETGSSFQTFLGTVTIIPEIENYRFGVDYIEAFSKLVPNVGSWKPPTSESVGLTSWITSHMNPGEYGGLGFLQIAEFYVQFGVFGIVAGFLIIGYFLTKWQKKCEAGLSDRRWVAINGCILCFLIIWIRNDIFNFIRPAAWSVFVIFGWTYFANKYRKKA